MATSRYPNPDPVQAAAGRLSALMQNRPGDVAVIAQAEAELEVARVEKAATRLANVRVGLTDDMKRRLFAALIDNAMPEADARDIDVNDPMVVNRGVLPIHSGRVVLVDADALDYGQLEQLRQTERAVVVAVPGEPRMMPLESAPGWFAICEPLWDDPDNDQPELDRPGGGWEVVR